MAARRKRGERPTGSRPTEALPLGSSRLQKLLAAAGMGSRRACETLVRDGRVSVNGRTAKLGDSADPAVDAVKLDGEKLIFDKPSYWILNKPKGVLTTMRDPEGRSTIAQLLPPGLERVFPVGRLDVDTEGLLLLTNDGAMAQTLLHPSLGSEREYDVVVRGELDDKAVRRLERGVRLEDGMTSPVRVVKLQPEPEASLTRLSLVLREGRNRQIRRSLLVVGHPVRRLVRVRMGPLKLGRLPRGHSRPLRSDEIAALRKHCRELVAQAPARAEERRGHKRSRSARDPSRSVRNKRQQ